MKIDITEIKPNDRVLCIIPIGHLSNNEVTEYVTKILSVLKDAFLCDVYSIPSRVAEELQFIIIRKEI